MTHKSSAWFIPCEACCALRHHSSLIIMDALQQQLEDLMSFRSDTELQFEDGTLEASSTVLAFFSSVLRGAVEAHSAATGTGNSAVASSCSGAKQQEKKIVIPVEGVSKQEWLQVAPFWYPVKPAAVVADWEQAELLLKVGSMFDLQPVLQAADAFIAANASKHLTGKQPEAAIWKWVVLADKSCLRDSVPVLSKLAVFLDRAGCSAADKLQSLSAVTLREFVRVLSSKQSEIYCSYCKCERVHSLNTSKCCTHQSINQAMLHLWQ
jgi:hypothetical protein